MRKTKALIIVLSSIIILGIFSIYQLNIQLKEWKTRSRLENYDFISKYDQLRYIDSIEFVSLDSKFIANSTLLEDEERHIRIEDLVKRDTWIFRFSDQDCETCIDSEIRKLKETPSLVKNLLILGSVTYNYQLKEKFRKTFNDQRILFVPDSAVSTRAAEFINTPYYVLIDSNLVVKKIFIPRKEFAHYGNMFYVHLEGGGSNQITN